MKRTIKVQSCNVERKIKIKDKVISVDVEYYGRVYQNHVLDSTELSLNDFLKAHNSRA